MYEIEEYVTDDNKMPFSQWVNGLKDKTAQRKIAQRLQRIRLGNLGDYKSLKGYNGLFELREHYGSGYRVYFSIVDNKIILLLGGSTKRDQIRTITKVADYLINYQERTKND